MTFHTLVAQLKKRLVRSPKERARELDYPSGFEPGLRHPRRASHVLLRDDGVIEATAGPGASLLVDGVAQTVTARGAAVRLAGERIQLACPPEGLYIGYQRLNPWWLTGPSEDPTRFFWQTAPLVQRYPGALEVAVVLQGAPAPGQVEVPLSRYFEAQPLFGPNEELLLLRQSLGRLVRSLVDHT